MDELKALRGLLSSPEPLPGPVVQRQREKLMTLIESTTATVPPTRRRLGRRRAVALVGVPAAAVLLAAAGWAALHQQARDAAAFSCVADGVTAVLPNDGTPRRWRPARTHGKPEECCRA
ncbi:MAG: hypothetical protein ACRD0U_14195 [Acidimicrobiales bacterium]